MSVVDISSIQYKLIGVCALKDKERDMLKRLWAERFSVQTAFFAEVEPGDKSLMMAQKIYNAINGAGYTDAHGFQVVLAVFLDLTEELDQDFLNALSGIANQLTNRLRCSVKFQTYCGFAGMVGMNDDVELLSSNAKRVVEANPYAKGLYLVGEPIFGGNPEYRWKAVTLLLDLLRRNANFQRFQSISHDNGTIGFLRYGEYNEEMLVNLKRQEKELIDHLGSNGHMEFSGELNRQRAVIEANARETFQVDGRMQPIHPDMIVTGFWKIQKAKSNNNKEFNQGRAHTMTALIETGDGLVNQIMEFYKTQLGDPKLFLMELLDRINAGIGFVENRGVLQSLLKYQLQPVVDAMPPALAYNEQGYAEEIGDYLTQKLNYGIYKANVQFYETLYNAYAAFSDVEIAKKRSEMQEKLNLLQNNLNHVSTKKEFCDLALGSGSGLDAQFMAFVGSSGDVTVKHLVCRRDEDKLWVENNCFVSDQQEARFFIHEDLGGLTQLDDAPVKALHAVLFDCTENRLQELLGM